jgi:hypothetical protein
MGLSPSLPFDDSGTRLGSFDMRKLFRRLIAVYVFMVVLLPTGSIFGINVKLLWFSLLLPVAVRFFFARGQATRFRLSLLFAIPGILAAWILVSQVYGFEPAYAIDQYKFLMTTISSCWLVALFCAEGQVETVYFIRVVVLSEVAASLLKGLLLTYAFVLGIPVTEVVGVVKHIFGVQLMTMNFESALGRIQFISDGLIPICIFAVLRYRKRLRFNAVSAIAILLLLLASDFFSFSRYFWGFTVLAIVMGLVFGKKDFFQLFLIAVLSVVTLVSLPFITTVMELRFSTGVAGGSDQERVTQISALEELFASSPVLGHGLGSFTTRVIRNDEAPWGYENQLLALTAQVGTVGMLFLSALALYYYRDLWPRHGRGWMQSLGLTSILIAWICAGLFNPELLSSPASISYAAIAAMAGLHETKLASGSRRNAKPEPAG